MPADTDTSKNSYKITLIGCGKMGGALLSGWIEADLVDTAQVLDPNGLPDSLQNEKIQLIANETEIAPDTDIIVLAVKPQILNDVCENIAKAKALPGALVISIAAGKALGAISAHFPDTTPVVRAMPNTPAAIGKGISVCCANQHVSAQHKKAASTLFAASGTAEWIEDEDLMHAVTAVSGSGPAYVFYLIEALTNAAIHQGLEPDFAAKLARQTVIGSAALADQSASIDAAILRENVTSPGGTTQAGLDILMDGRFQDLLDETIQAAAARSKELSS